MERYIDRGWSPEKHETRVAFYTKAYKYVGHEVFMKGLHIMLGGACEDAKYLTDFWRIPKQNLKIVEKDISTATELVKQGWDVINNDIYKEFENISEDSLIASINLDVTQTLRTLVKSVEDFPKYRWKNKFLCHIVYDIKRTRRNDLDKYQANLDILFDHHASHNRYQSWTLNNNGLISRPKGSTMGYVVYPIKNVINSKQE